jgi:hypothetical protein
MAVSAFFFRQGTEENATLVFMAIMDFIVILFVARALLKIFQRLRG